MLTLSELREILPRSGASAALYLEPLNSAMEQFDIDNPDRQAAFLATIAVESRELTRVSENLNFTHAQRIADLWPARFVSATVAEPYVGMPEMLANVVYANRMGNGPVESGDGWRFRGAGLIQISGRSNHQACANHFQMPLDQVSGWMQTQVGAARSACWFWWRNACSVLADQGQFTTITRKINGGQIGMTERLEYLARARMVLGAGE